MTNFLYNTIPLLLTLSAVRTGSVPLGCFSGLDTLTMQDGTNKTFEQLQVGDQILSADQSMNLKFSPIIFLPHIFNENPTPLIEVKTAGGNILRMTPNHLVPLCEGGELATAIELTVGSCLRIANSDNNMSEGIAPEGDFTDTVREVKRIIVDGVYTAVTLEKYIVVGGVLALPFTRWPDQFRAKFDDVDVEIWCSSPSWTSLYRKLNAPDLSLAEYVPNWTKDSDNKLKVQSTCKAILKKMYKNYRDVSVGWGINGWGYRNFAKSTTGMK